MLHPTGFYATYANEFGMTVPPSAVSSAVSNSNLYIDNSRLTRRGGGLYATDAAVMESISLSSSSVDASLVFTDVSRSNAAVPAAAANDAANNLEREDRLDDGAQDGAWPSRGVPGVQGVPSLTEPQAIGGPNFPCLWQKRVQGKRVEGG